MKTLIFFLAVFLTVSSQAQVIHFTIEGAIQKPQKVKFIYLVSQSIDASKNDLFLVNALNGNQFKIIGSSNLGGQLLKEAFIFLDENGNITLDEVKLKIKNKVWFVGGTANLKTIYLENIKLDMENQYNIKDAKIISGGTYLKQSKDFMLALRNRNILGFVQKNADSPVALAEVSKLTSMFSSKQNKLDDNPFALKSVLGSAPETIYEALSQRLKKTKQGIALKKKIEEEK